MKNSLTEKIRETIAYGRDLYTKILSDPQSIEYRNIDLDCSSLPTPIWGKGKEQDKSLSSFFGPLENPDHAINKKACLYYFEIISSDTTKILNQYRHFKEEDFDLNWRACPALKKNPPMDTTILYVGKVKSNISGRMFVHLGYYHVGATSGLQLACWARGLGLHLRVHIFAFEGKMHEFVDPLELPLARTLKPLIGKH